MDYGGAFDHGALPPRILFEVRLSIEICEKEPIPIARPCKSGESHSTPYFLFSVATEILCMRLRMGSPSPVPLSQEIASEKKPLA
jgi:hypothetical protein